MANMRLYALCDQDMLDKRGISIEDFIDIAKVHNAEIIQYRNKSADIAYIKKQLIKIRQMYKGFLIINDAYELADFCDGVHLGQEDLKAIDSDIKKAVSKVRNIIKNDKLLGISTHNEEEVIEANSLDVNYIGLGAYKDTDTKNDIRAVLGESLDAIASKSTHKVGAIGGVSLNDKFNNVTYNVIGSGLI